jgi:hypothetical protein
MRSLTLAEFFKDLLRYLTERVATWWLIVAAGKTCGNLILAAFISHAVYSLGYLFKPIAFLQADFRYFQRIGSYKACQKSLCLVPT